MGFLSSASDVAATAATGVPATVLVADIGHIAVVPDGVATDAYTDYEATGDDYDDDAHDDGDDADADNEEDDDDDDECSSFCC